MSNGEFETIYNEAFLSATGEPADASRFCDRQAAFIAAAESHALEKYTASSPLVVCNVLSQTKNVENIHIRHPAEGTFDEEDIRRIAMVRWLGRVIIDTAKEQLAKNPVLQHTDEEVTGTLFGVFQPYEWHKNHPKIDPTEDLSMDSNVASPLRLGSWPNGEYLNCLGVSIALAAGCELAGLPYLYGNEIRMSDVVVGNHHQQIMKKIAGHYDYFGDEVTRSVLLKTMHDRREPDELYDDILYDTPPALKTGTERIRDFHHFVLSETSDEDGKMWVHLDPYSISYAYVSPERRNIDKIIEPFFSPGNENTVVLSDEHEMVHSYFRRIDDSIELGSHLSEAIRQKFSANYKSGNYFIDLETKTKTATHNVLSGLFGVDESNAQVKRNDEQLADDLFFHTIVEFGRTLPEVNQMLKKIHKPKNAESLDWEKVYYSVEQNILQAIRFKPDVRAELVARVSAIPFLAVVHVYEYNLKNALHIREVGDASTVMEVGDPEFMIGAMYMNHYATWRKDGRINVARHLSRICSSQLLWQAARQGENEVDDRMVAMETAVINKLKPRQRHPLVNLASGIPIHTTIG